MIGAAERMLALSDADTKIIPGHGPLSDRESLRAYRDMLVAVRDRIRGLIREGKALAQVQAAKPTAQFDAHWGAGSITPERFVEIVYTDLAARK